MTNALWQQELSHEDPAEEAQYWKQRALDEYGRCNNLIKKVRELESSFESRNRDIIDENKSLQERLHKQNKTNRDACYLLKELQSINSRQDAKIKHLTRVNRKLLSPAEAKTQRRTAVLTVPTYLL